MGQQFLTFMNYFIPGSPCCSAVEARKEILGSHPARENFKKIFLNIQQIPYNAFCDV